MPAWNGLNPFHDGKRFSLSHYEENWRDFIVLDIERRHYELVKESGAGYPPSRNGISADISPVPGDKKQNRSRLNLYSHVEKRLVRSIETSLPLGSFLRVLADRFVIADTAQEIRWMDLTDPNETWHAFPISRGNASWLWGHQSLPVFRRTAFKPVQAGSTQAPQSYTELFQFDDQGQLRLLSSWSNSHSGFDTLRDAWFQDDTIASLAPDGASVELRSLDGQLIRSLVLTPPVDLTKQKFIIRYGSMSVEDGPRYRCYSLAHEKWLAPPLDAEGEWTRASMEFSPDSRTALWHSRPDRAAVITDPVTDVQICKIQQPGERFAFLDANSLISIDSRFGLTVRRHDSTTGATLSTWRPFGWVLPTFVITILSSTLWVRSWLRMPRHDPMWAWVDLHLLLLLLMVLIVSRLRSVGDPSDIGRMPYQHAIYVTSSFLFAAWGWLILGSGSIVSRVSHLLLVYAILLGALSQAIATDAILAWMGCALVTIPSLLALPVFVVARIRGWMWFDVKTLAQQRGAVSRTEFISLGQLLIVTAVFALLFLAARPLVSGMAGVFQLQWPLLQAAAVTTSGLAAILLAANRRTSLQRVGLAIAVGLVSLLVVEAISLATYTGWWKPDWWWQHEMQTRHCLGFYCTVFIVTSVFCKPVEQKVGQGSVV